MKTVIISSLDPRDLPFNLKNFSLVISDVDYTLVDADKYHRAGIKELSRIFGNRMANKVDEMFNLIVEGYRRPQNEDWTEREAFNYIINRTQRLQNAFVDHYGAKVWSRETWLLLAGEKLGIKLSKEQIESGRDAYWSVATQSTQLYEDAKVFLQIIDQLVTPPLILMTSSDSILVVNNDCSLDYDPIYAEEYKRKRLVRIFPKNRVIIGDPIDKPATKFFDKLFQIVREIGNFPMDKVLVVGDSERNDLDGPRERGCKTLLIKRN